MFSVCVQEYGVTDRANQVPTGPHYVRITCSVRGSGPPSLRSCRLCEEKRCGSGFQPRRARRRQGGLLCKGVTPRRDRGIDSGERGQVFKRGCGGKLGGHSCHPRKVEAPDALYTADHPCLRRAPCCTVGDRTPGIPSGRCPLALILLFQTLHGPHAEELREIEVVAGARYTMQAGPSPPGKRC